MDLNTIVSVARPARRAELPAWRDGDALLAGGTWLFSEPQTHLRRLVDLAGLGWPPATISAEGLGVAATCTLAQLAALRCPAEWIAAALIAPCCEALLGSFKIRHVATFGGNICLALPAAPMIALATALDGVCRIWTPGGGERHIAALDFVTDAQQTCLLPGEVLRAVDLPAHALSRRAAFRRASLTPLGRSAALLIGTHDREGGFALTVTAATRRPRRLEFGSVPAADELAARIAADIPNALYHDDVHGAPEWRRHMTLDLAEDIRAELAQAGA